MALEDARRRMVEMQLRARGLNDPRLLQAFLDVPRHAFVPPDRQADAYADRPIPIGAGQTISQPYIVALMLHQLRLLGHERVLEIGTGSGYQTALLAHLALEVYAVERLPALSEAARQRLGQLDLLNVHLTVADGSLGWVEHAPYDGIIVGASVPRIPPSLLAQLGDGGRLVLPVGFATEQTLTLAQRQGASIQTTPIAACSFVPLIGQESWPS